MVDQAIIHLDEEEQEILAAFERDEVNLVKDQAADYKNTAPMPKLQ